MSDEIGPVHIKERPGSEMQSRVDAEVCFDYLLQFTIISVELLNIKLLLISQVVKLLREAYNRVKALLKKVILSASHDHTMRHTCLTSSLDVNGSSLHHIFPLTQNQIENLTK